MKILCATDLSPKSGAAQERACQLANQLGADLTLLRVEPQARPGNPARVVLDTLEQSRAKLLVLGPHRKHPVRSVFESTIAEKVLAAKQCPVLIVRDAVRGPYRRVLLALDVSDASATALRAAESLVLEQDTAARVVYAYEPPYQGMLHYADVGADSMLRYSAGWERAANFGIRDLLESESAHSARYDIHIERLPAAPAILKSIERYEPDLIVMGTQGGGRLRRALSGSVANRVLHEAECDTLIVPDGSFGVARSKLLFGVRFPLEHARGGRRVAAA